MDKIIEQLAEKKYTTNAFGIHHTEHVISCKQNEAFVVGFKAAKAVDFVEWIGDGNIILNKTIEQLYEIFLNKQP
jgi:hypothetical protein